jgi:hypothetical protein
MLASEQDKAERQSTVANVLEEEYLILNGSQRLSPWRLAVELVEIIIFLEPHSD